MLRFKSSPESLRWEFELSFKSLGYESKSSLEFEGVSRVSSHLESSQVSSRYECEPSLESLRFRWSLASLKSGSQGSLEYLK